MPDGRFLLRLRPACPHLVTHLDDGSTTKTTSSPSYTIDRGRQYELDQTDTGRAIVEINDTEGVLDPTNPCGPFYGEIETGLQALIQRRNPISSAWRTRFRGFVEDYDYSLRPLPAGQPAHRLAWSICSSGCPRSR